MNEENQINEPEQIKKLLEQNLKLTEEIYAMTKKMKSYLAFQRLVSLFYLVLIIAPIILSIIYLPPLLNNLFSQYKDALGIEGGPSGTIQGLLNGGAGNLDLNNLDVNNLPPQVKQLLDK
ncbi:MAG: hypothetical protein Q8O93_03910 [bacterium]|nr:hypothetical protein [bacterium]